MKTKADLDALIPTLVDLLTSQDHEIGRPPTMSKVKMVGVFAMNLPLTTSAMRKMVGSSK